MKSRVDSSLPAMHTQGIMQPITIAFLLAVGAASSLAAQDRPNIVFMFSDDLTTQAISAYKYGLDLPETPNLDLLASQDRRPATTIRLPSTFESGYSHLRSPSKPSPNPRVSPPAKGATHVITLMLQAQLANQPEHLLDIDRGIPPPDLQHLASPFLTAGQSFPGS